MSKRHDPNVGRAFRGDDNVIRWIASKSTRGYYQLLWLDEASGVWWQGGITKVAPTGAEMPAPQPGETYKLAGVFGGYREVAA